MNLFRAKNVFRKCSQYVEATFPGALCHFKGIRGDAYESVWSFKDQFIFVVGRYISNKEVDLCMVHTSPTKSYRVIG